MQLDYALEGYWLAKRRDFSSHTVSDYQLTLRRFSEFVGKTRDLKDISSDDVNRFLNHLRDDLGHSPKTVLNAWTAIRHACAATEPSRSRRARALCSSTIVIRAVTTAFPRPAPARRGARACQFLQRSVC